MVTEDDNSLSWLCYNIGKNQTNYKQSSPYYHYEEVSDWNGEIMEFWVISDYGLSGKLRLLVMIE